MSTKTQAGGASGLDRYFRITERGSTVGTEIRGGVVTFFTMAYIVVLNPLILGFAQDADGTARICPTLITAHVLADPAASLLPGFGFERETMLAEARAVAEGKAFGVFNEEAQGLIAPYRTAITLYDSIGLIVTILVGFAGGTFAFLRLKPDFTARTRVERAVMALLLIASLVAMKV